jgi:hypothetical protein
MCTWNTIGYAIVIKGRVVKTEDLTQGIAGKDVTIASRCGSRPL